MGFLLTGQSFADETDSCPTIMSVVSRKFAREKSIQEISIKFITSSEEEGILSKATEDQKKEILERMIKLPDLVLGWGATLRKLSQLRKTKGPILSPEDFKEILELTLTIDPGELYAKRVVEGIALNPNEIRYILLSHGTMWSELRNNSLLSQTLNFVSTRDYEGIIDKFFYSVDTAKYGKNAAERQMRQLVLPSDKLGSFIADDKKSGYEIRYLASFLAIIQSASQPTVEGLKVHLRQVIEDCNARINGFDTRQIGKVEYFSLDQDKSHARFKKQQAETIIAYLEREDLDKKFDEIYRDYKKTSNNRPAMEWFLHSIVPRFAISSGLMFTSVATTIIATRNFENLQFKVFGKMREPDVFKAPGEPELKIAPTEADIAEQKGKDEEFRALWEATLVEPGPAQRKAEAEFRRFMELNKNYTEKLINESKKPGK